MKRVAFVTLGCKVNQYDSQAMAELFEAEGYQIVPPEEQADIYVINTCTVTSVADKKSRQLLSRFKRNHPHAGLVAAGCLAQSDPQTLAEMGVDCVLGTDKRSELLQFLRTKQRQAVGDIMQTREFEELSVSRSGEKTRGLVKIQEGCNNYCSYCIIPYVRGVSRSRSLQSIVREAHALAQAGIREVVLTGIHIDSYERADLRLLDVVEAVAQVDGIERIRLGSLEPGGFRPEEIERLSHIPKLCEQFHVSLQSGATTVLSRMRRRYSAEEYAEYVDLIRSCFERPAITTDVIVGFPGESEAEFEQTCEFVRRIAFAKVHVFPYSARRGTKAAQMPNQIPKQVKLARAKTLIKLTDELEESYLDSFIGKTVEVLLEQPDGDAMVGHARRYMRVHAQGRENEIVRCTVTARADKTLIAN